MAFIFKKFFVIDLLSKNCTSKKKQIHQKFYNNQINYGIIRKGVKTKEFGGYYTNEYKQHNKSI